MSLFNSKDLIIKNISDICTNQYTQYLFSYPNVVGFAFGQKIINNKKTGVPCFTFFVESKIPEDQLSKENIVPKTINGINTDVIQRSKIRIRKSINTNNKSSIPNKLNYCHYFKRPIVGGVQCGYLTSGNYGTIGCAVIKDDSIFILTNNHVVDGNNPSSIGAPIYSPSFTNGGCFSEPIATVYKANKIIPLGDTKDPSVIKLRENIIDAAICYVGNINDPDIKDKIIGGVYLLGPLKGVNNNPSIGDTVRVVGATTTYTKGEITALNHSGIVHGDDRLLYTNQIVTNNYGKSGDSGAVGVDMDNRVLGLEFAGSDKTSTFNPINYVLSEFGVSIL